ncbi:hypothetical protein Sjap_019772 [Stephania japonica]|uniref:Uncharacterized protein n=1 Tax=Stephania japonica TaxID=461633 RepID=A0AAP0F6R6_9MAGN
MILADHEVRAEDEQQQQNGGVSTGMFCISNCRTCPVVCTSQSSMPTPTPPPPQFVDGQYSPPDYSQYIQNPPPPPATPVLFPDSPAVPTPPFSHLNNNPLFPAPPSRPTDYYSSSNYPYYMVYSSKAAGPPVLTLTSVCISCISLLVVLYINLVS